MKRMGSGAVHMPVYHAWCLTRAVHVLACMCLLAGHVTHNGSPGYACVDCVDP